MALCPSGSPPGQGGQRGRGVGAAVQVVEGLQGALGAVPDVGELHRGPGRAKGEPSSFVFITQLLFSSKKKTQIPRFGEKMGIAASGGELSAPPHIYLPGLG